MEIKDREKYLFNKKCLLVLLYLYYINGIDYKDINFRSFGFHFDPKCDFKVIVNSKKDHVHKYIVHIYSSLSKVNLESLDIMGNVNFIKVKSLKNDDYYNPEASLNIYLDDSNFLALGFIEGKKIEYTLKSKESESFLGDDLLYYLNRNKKNNNESFIMFLLKLYTYRLNVDLVIGAGINVDYGVKDWKRLVDALNSTFYNNDVERINEIKHYVGSELFVNGKVLKTSGFDTYKELNNEIYLVNFNDENKKSFSTTETSLYALVEYLESHKDTEVITYNYDTNLEYLLRKKEIIYNTIYDEFAFTSKDNSSINIYHVHGLLPYNKYNESRFVNSLIFNESDYYYLYNNPYSWNISKQLHDFTFKCCVFVGISLTDPNMKRLLEVASNYLKFNFIFMKKEKGYKDSTLKDVTNYFFTYDLITIWVDDYSEINKWLSNI